MRKRLKAGPIEICIATGKDADADDAAEADAITNAILEFPDDLRMKVARLVRSVIDDDDVDAHLRAIWGPDSDPDDR